VSVFVGNRCYLKNSSVPLSASSRHLACRLQAGRSNPDRPEGSRKAKTRVVKPASCSTYKCGSSFSPLQSCQCNVGCTVHGNCCYDYAEQCSSSARKGNGDSNISIPVHTVSCAAYGCDNYRGSSSCQCTAKCREFNNCCHDYKVTCQAGGGGDYGFDDADDAGTSSTTQGSSSKTVLKTSSDGTTLTTADVTTAAPTAAAVTATVAAATARTAAVTTPAETARKVTSTAEAFDSVPFTTAQTDSGHTSNTTKATHRSIIVPFGCHTVVGRFLFNCQNPVVPLKKFLQTVPRLDKGHEAFHRVPNLIASLAAVTVFTTLMLRARTQLCRTREQDDAEAEQLLEPMGNICEQQSGGTPFLHLHQ